MGELTARTVTTAAPGRHHAGTKGLYLFVTPDGGPAGGFFATRGHPHGASPRPGWAASSRVTGGCQGQGPGPSGSSRQGRWSGAWAWPCGQAAVPYLWIKVPVADTPAEGTSMITRTNTILVAVCVLAGAPSAAAAPRHHHADRGARHHAAIRTDARVRTFAPCAAYGYGCQAPDSAEERWFRRAKGNIWGGWASSRACPIRLDISLGDREWSLPVLSCRGQNKVRQYRPDLVHRTMMRVGIKHQKVVPQGILDRMQYLGW